MRDFREFPTVSMGIGPLKAIYQAHFNKYMNNRGMADSRASRLVLCRGRWMR
jgi:pyruvate dehydrogenase E1 component